MNTGKVSEKTKCYLEGFGEGFPDALVGDLYFTWSCSLAGNKQTSYRICVSAKPFSDDVNEMLWDSEWVTSDKSSSILYEGEKFESDKDYYAFVSVKDNTGNTIQSPPISFVTGLSPHEWVADWLKQYEPEGAAPMFRKEFCLKDEIERARLYICGLGYYEAYVNGRKIGNDVMSPAWTDYRKRVCYVSYDVKNILNEGSDGQTGINTIGIMLGNGWYGITVAKDTDNMLFSLELSIEYKDGSKDWLYSKANDGWMVYSAGPLMKNSIYIGEVYDARCELLGWSETGYCCNKSTGWNSVIRAEPPLGCLVPQNLEPIEVIREMVPVSIKEPASGTYVIDFGQNMAAVMGIELEEEEGKEIVLRYSELIDSEGMLNTANLRSAQAKDVYICNGKKSTYLPRFTYHGFRYAEVTGITKPLDANQVKAYVIRNNVAKRGSFFCSNELVNKIQSLCVWTESNNLHGVPTDCPQRDERLGWLNDLTVRAEEALYNFDLHRFYNKYLQDIADEQGEKTGALTDTVPYIRYGGQPADPVCSSYLILAWLLYEHYGDKAVLEQFYGGLSAWTNYLAKSTEDGIVTYSYYGDWASPIAGSLEGSYGSGAVSSITPGKLMSTGFLYYNARLMETIANIIDKKEDARQWKELKTLTRAALNKAYYNEDTGSYATGSQASNTFMLWLGIVPDEGKTMDKLIKSINDKDIHLSTGNICSRYILEVLTEKGYVDLAFQLVTQTTYPSWGYMVSMGATTTWERWEYVDSGVLLGMASHDHPMYSTVSAWFYRYLLGIRVLTPGFETFTVNPYPPKALEWVKGTLDTVKGKVEAEWHQDENEFLIDIIVPFNSRCKYVIPQMLSANALVNGDSVIAAVDSNCRFIWLDAGSYHIVQAKIKNQA